VASQLDKLDEIKFAELDVAILRLAKRPTPAGSKPKYYRWFLGDLRRAVMGDFPVVYRVEKDTNQLQLLFLGLRHWTRLKTSAEEKASRRGTARLSAQKKSKQHQTRSWTNTVIAYAGESAEELLAYPPQGQHEAIVDAFREGILRKARRAGYRSLAREEKIVLAVTALEQEVNNGGYDQFLRNESGRFSPIIVDALQRIGCLREARITRKALGAIGVRRLELRSIAAAMRKDDDCRDEKLERCDQQFYREQKGMAKRLYAFIKTNRRQFSFGRETTIS
jgi:hypothetical protein